MFLGGERFVLLQVFIPIGTVLGLYLFLKVLLRIGSVLFNLSLLYFTVLGYRYYADVAPSKRLVMYFCPVNLLCEDTLEETYNFLRKMVQSDAVDLEYYRQSLLKYDYLCLYRDRITGALKGMQAYSINCRERNGQQFSLFQIGMGFFKRAYSGGALFYANVLLNIVWSKLCHPSRPVYFSYKVYSYMSYLFAINNFKEVFPRYDCPDPPEFYKSLLHELGHRVSDKYDPETFVVKQETNHVREFVAPITKEELQNPHIAYFNKLNPGWKKGHCLLICAKATWSDLFRMCVKTLKREVLPRKKRQKLSLSGRSTIPFVTEEQFLRRAKKHGCSVGKLTDSDLDVVNEDQAETSPSRERRFTTDLQTKRNSFVKTPSLAIGVDRIDQYSQVEIRTP